MAIFTCFLGIARPLNVGGQVRIPVNLLLSPSWFSRCAAAVREILMKMCFVQNGFHQNLKNSSIDFQKDNTIETTLMRSFYRNLKLENRCRNKEIASYFQKITFFVKFPVRPSKNLVDFLKM